MVRSNTEDIKARGVTDAGVGSGALLGKRRRGGRTELEAIEAGDELNAVWESPTGAGPKITAKVRSLG